MKCLVYLVQGVKEVTLLGQNVNSYRDTSQQQFCGAELTQLSRGFKTIYRTKLGGLRFSDLLDHVSRIDPDMRIRFTSPHPKDFPDEVDDALNLKSQCGVHFCCLWRRLLCIKPSALICVGFFF